MSKVRTRTLAVALSIVALAALGIAATGGAAAGKTDYPDPLPTYPDNYRVLLENEHVRVLDFRLAKGASEATHKHPAHLAVFLGEFQIEFTAPDGTKSMRDAHHGQVAWSAGTVHASKNVGQNDGHGILIELKNANPPAAPGVSR